MRSYLKFIFVLLSLGVFCNVSAHAQTKRNSVAILAIPEHDGSLDAAKTLSVEQMVQVAGAPFIVTQNVDSAVTYAAIIPTQGFNGKNLSDSQRQKLKKYVKQGGLLISPNFKDPGLFKVFGISGEDYSRNRYSFSFNVNESDPTFSGSTSRGKSPSL